MRKAIALSLAWALALFPAVSFAASGFTTITINDGGGTGRTVNVNSSTGLATGNLSWLNTICDFTTITQCASVTAANALKVDGSAVTQPVSAAASSFAAGALADGADTTLGAKADTAWVSGAGSLIAIAKTIAGNTGAAVPAGTNVIGFTSNDQCAQGTKLGAPINLTASGQVIAGTSAKKTYICSLDIVTATAQNIALVEGTGTTCATNIFGLAGGTTAATGWNLAANGGLTKGSGAGTVYSPSADTNGTAANVCLLLSGTGQTSGQITYVQQ